MTAAELGSRISSAELSDWSAYEQIEGPVLVGERVDYAGALIGSIVANSNRKKGSKAVKPGDLLPKWERPEPQEPLTPEQQRAKVLALLGGKAQPAEPARRLLDAKGNELPSPAEREARD